MSNASQIPVFDGHNDTLTREDYGDFVTGRRGGHLDLPRMKVGGMRGGIFAIFSPTPPGRGGKRVRGAPLDHTLAAADATAAAGRVIVLDRAGAVRLARSIADVDAAESGEGPPVAVLHLEGAEAIDPGLEALDLWHAAGLRSIGPVWSRPNAFATGIPLAAPASPDLGPGLTDAGKALVRRCAELGIVIDLSHLNEAGFWDVAKLDVKPLVASHSAAHAICPNSRNLTDRQIDAIGATGGLVGIVFGPRFIRPDAEELVDTPISLIAQHARYIADRIGAQHVALGSDFDGTTMPAPLGDVTGLPALLAELTTVGFSPEEVAAIAWHNWRRVLDQWWAG
ncbi:MAG TPA: dipeptidase [Conexibacter sp.]|jgi:membrane dipeptidase